MVWLGDVGNCWDMWGFSWVAGASFELIGWSISFPIYWVMAMSCTCCTAHGPGIEMTSSPTLETLAEEASRSSRKNIAEPSPISTEVGVKVEMVKTGGGVQVPSSAYMNSLSLSLPLSI